MIRIPLAVPNLEGDEAQLLQECITSTFVSSVGPFVTEFEQKIATLSGVSQAAVVSSGTVALKIALEALGVGRGELVIIPSLTFIASANAVKHCGAEPWVFDVNPNSWCLDADECRRELEAKTEATDKGRVHRDTGQVVKAIMPVMIMGAAIDFAAFRSVAQEYGLKLVVDAAAAIGGAGAQGEGLAATGVDAVCYSFNGNKTVTCGGGGAIAAPDDGLIDIIRHMTTTGRRGPNYDHDIVAYNYRMTNMQAAVGVAQLRRLDQFLAAKAAHAQAYSEFAGTIPDLAPYPKAKGGRHTHWFSGFYYTGEDFGRIESFHSHMHAAGIALPKFWKPVHLQTPYTGALQTGMPICEDLWPRIFTLPCSTHLSEADRDYVIAAARTFWEEAV